MNILVLCHKPPYPTVDGGTIASLQIINDLQKSGHQLTVLAMSTPKHPGNVNDIPEQLCHSICFEYVNIDTTVRLGGLLRNFFLSKIPYTAERFISKHFACALTQLLNKNDFDLIQLEGLYLTPYIPLIRKELKTPVILRAHNIENEIWQRITKSKQNLVKHIYLKNLTKRIRNFELDAINRYDILVPISEKDLRWFNENANKKPALVIPASIADEKIPSLHPSKKPADVFYLGALDWKPNVEGLYWFIKKCWPMILKNHPSCQFHIAGRNAPKKVISHLSKQKNVRFHGQVPDASKFMQEHDIMLVPLFSGSGMRVKIIEAMAHGKAVVTTSIGTEGVASQHGENILIADNVSGYTACIDQLINNPDYLNKLSQQAQKLIKERYVSSVIGKSLSEFYCKYLSC